MSNITSKNTEERQVAFRTRYGLMYNKTDDNWTLLKNNKMTPTEVGFDDVPEVIQEEILIKKYFIREGDVGRGDWDLLSEDRRAELLRAMRKAYAASRRTGE